MPVRAKTPLDLDPWLNARGYEVPRGGGSFSGPLYDHYVAWCRGHSLDPAPAKRWGRAMGLRFKRRTSGSKGRGPGYNTYYQVVVRGVPIGRRPKGQVRRLRREARDASAQESPAGWIDANFAMILNRCKARWRPAQAAGWEWDDWVHEGVVIALEAIGTWRPDGGAKMSSWVYTQLEYRLLNMIRDTAWARNGYWHPVNASARRAASEGYSMVPLDAPAPSQGRSPEQVVETKMMLDRALANPARREQLVHGLVAALRGR